MISSFQVGDKVVVDFYTGTYTVLEFQRTQVWVRGAEGTIRVDLDSIAHAPPSTRSCPICYDLGSVEGVPCGRCNFATEAPISSQSILVAARAAGQSVQVTPPAPEYVPNIYRAMMKSDWAGGQKIQPMFAFIKGVTE